MSRLPVRVRNSLSDFRRRGLSSINDPREDRCRCTLSILSSRLYSNVTAKWNSTSTKMCTHWTVPTEECISMWLRGAITSSWTVQVLPKYGLSRIESNVSAKTISLVRRLCFFLLLRSRKTNVQPDVPVNAERWRCLRSMGSERTNQCPKTPGARFSPFKTPTNPNL